MNEERERKRDELPRPQCEKCGERDRIQGERFCHACRKEIVGKVRELPIYGPLRNKVRSISDDGADEIGRSPHTAWSALPEMRVENEEAAPTWDYHRRYAVPPSRFATEPHRNSGHHS